MYRLMQPSEQEILVQLWAKSFAGSEERARMLLCQLAGPTNSYVAEENGQPVGMLIAVPVTLQGKNGVCIYGIAVEQAARGKGVAQGLLDYACKTLTRRGAAFAVAAPRQQKQFAWLEKQGFSKAFALRRVKRPICRNIWSQAEFDSVPAKKLCELRQKYWPSTVQVGTKEMIPILTDLYSRGVTIVSSDEGYGLYFRRGETLQFIELMADGDRAAECLMEAAREKEVIVENAEILVGAEQNLFLGEGTREDCGMIRFFAEPMNVQEGYFHQLLNT